MLAPKHPSNVFRFVNRQNRTEIDGDGNLARDAHADDANDDTYEDLSEASK